MVQSFVNIGLTFWEGVVDRRISHGNTKLTRNSRATTCLE